MNFPKLSVLLPVRNGEATLQRALDSLWQQSFTDFEVVVVNDGSTDGTSQILQHCADKRLRVLEQEGKGIAAALNKGLSYCKAPLIARMDADDLAHPQRFEKQWLYMERHPEVDVLACRVSFGGNEAVAKGYALYVEAINELLTHEQMWARRFWDAPLAHPSVIFKKEIVVQAGGYSKAPLPEDYELWLRLFERGCRFAKIPEQLLRWSDHPERLSRTHPNYHKEAFWRLKSTYFSRWIQKAFPEELPPVYIWGETKKKSRSRYLLDAGISIAGRIGMEGAKGEGLIPYTAVSLLEKGAIILIYVSNRWGKKEIIGYLAKYGYVEGKTYFLMV